jgi:threonylcarbamoyladenosine tRNA methylthiotransferase MtaB
MPAVRGPTIKDRAAQLRAKGDAALQAHLAAQVGQLHQVLTEGPRLGRTEGFAEIAFGNDQPEGQIITVQITGVAGGRLTAA